jgi:hypothetical protein
MKRKELLVMMLVVLQQKLFGVTKKKYEKY